MVLSLLIVALRPTGGGCESLRDQLRETGAQHRANFREIQTPGRGRGEYSGIITRHKKERRRRLNTGGRGARCRGSPFLEAI